MASCSPLEDYQVGQVLSLGVISEPGESQLRPASTVRVRIQQLQNPRTLSCCMAVNILDEGHPDNPAFLKLYDRRFSEQLRRDHGIDPWTIDAEREYIKAVKTGAARRFLHSLHTIPNFEDETGETWDDGQIETFLEDQARQLFDAETTVYDSLRDIQGKQVPRLVARVHLTISLPEDDDDDDDNVSRTDDVAEQLDVRGVLLQHIDGFSLSKVQEHAPRSDWQGIVDQAVAVVHAVGDRGILNRDVRPDNFLVRRDGHDGSYQVFMIDFGLARLRGQNEPDRDWAKAKLEKDEEGAVGLVMKKRLAKEGFELRFEMSDRYLEWAGGDDE